MPSTVQSTHGWTVSKNTTIIPSDDAHIVARRNAGEVVTCYNGGTAADRASIIWDIDDFCEVITGTTLERATITRTYNYGNFTVRLWGRAINECRWTVDSNCNRLLRYPVDSCNTGTTLYKKGT
ncbi:hypothetical protein BJ165DRAFT_929665 [Panaeolus papilionaceus]|nr:hypothetical protein BJ165DRAFT_929665 [Panaeolus papilionaceus]